MKKDGTFRIFERPATWFAFLVLLTTSLFADSWAPPRSFSTVSENQKFIGTVFPATNTGRAVFVVSTLSGGKTNPVWRVDLTNSIAPTTVWLSDDGSHVITADNWGSAGYGNDVLVLYSRDRGLLKGYSLEQFAPPSKPGRGFRLNDGYENRISHSTSSRHWRRNCIETLFQNANGNLFCIWLDWDKRWVAWRLDTGELAPISATLANQLNNATRTQILGRTKAGRQTEADLNFLGMLRITEDRPIVESWLKDSVFTCGSVQTSSSESPEIKFKYYASSHKREAADCILTKWDKLESEDNSNRTHREVYQFLGGLECIITFPTAPKSSEGSILLYLIPNSIPLHAWDSTPPDHFLIADLRYSFPRDFLHGKLRDGKLAQDVEFSVHGITPGKYRAKVVWNRTEPIAPTDQILVRPHLGDFESMDSPVIPIRRGKVTSGVHIRCETPATN